MMESSLTTPYHRIAFPLLAFYDLTRAHRALRQVIKAFLLNFRGFFVFCSKCFGVFCADNIQHIPLLCCKTKGIFPGTLK